MADPDPSFCSGCGRSLARDNTSGRCFACQAADRESVGLPPDVPAEFWEDLDLQRAFAERHMGHVIRAYRHQPSHGRRPLPQELVAAWFGITQSQLSRIENGPPPGHLDQLIHWASVLQIPERHLWYKLPVPEGADREAGDVKRRTFLSTASTMVLGGATPRVPAATAAPHAVMAPSALSAAMLVPRLQDDVDPLDALSLRRSVRHAWQLRQEAKYETLTHVLPSLIRQSEGAVVGHDAEHLQATHAVVHTYNTASSLFKRLGDGQLAILAADRAVRASQQIDDPVLTAAAMYRLANVLLADSRLDETQTVALAAADLADPGHMQTDRSLAIWGGLLLTASVAAARAGDAIRAWELLGEARTGSRLLKTDHADMYAIFGPTNVAIHGVQIAVELGAGREALRRSKHVDADRLPPSLVERRGQLLVDIATGHVMEGEDHAAIATLQRALDVAPQEVQLNRDAHNLVRTMLRREVRGSSEGLRSLASQLGVEA